MNAKNKILEKRAKILLWDKGLDVSKLARLIHRSRTWTSQVLYGHANSEAMRESIASVIGEYIWSNENKKAA